MTAIRLPLSRRLAGRVPVRRILWPVPLVLVLVVALRHRSVLAEGFDRLATARWPWLTVALGATCLTWVAAAVTRQGALVERLPAGRLPATQFAAGAANHLLPTGLGASAVNLRFMTVCGVSLPRSSAALALYLLAESVARVGLLLALLLAFPRALRLGPLLPDGTSTPLLVGAVVTASAAVALVLLVRRLRTAVFRFVRTALGEARSIHARPVRVLALWSGSLAFPALQAGVLVAVGLALGLDVPVAHMALAYLAATVAVALVPTPGGLGSVEAALVVALVAAGGPVAVATAVVLAFRIITVWLPLLPGALTLSALVRLKVI
ncbi:lysylphosphatidylglycerol synthase transmembrane domain-containing protein [Streptomyces scabiei]|uniref:lysylphosphatidylglycerol synthase transmembrane domain-containing protein n=1 Tax=Streptomyces scabiei TaxID=1930 RepID=UPI0029AC95CC|nr:lysylphosphatidylglycerol synthase transmembrane domain-containing protein [Streptomyces scabiei]MDX2538420.1 lysylphosphatidylglycerol synthase transmembrane domain-containing protein [Streptomyces scabiei]MDX2799338.1 lysylphosphatidylglycerol synthase transmembrane domain-containing protein [Streptomyces scabiei]MDX2858257.1 lysylphosphatidylglycerol synthase transmembrane domain-containing protein [Streptomyces scabiei]MDX3827992.1 lysylphosphatidylglycerol synthase transmembrane domain-